MIRHAEKRSTCFWLKQIIHTLLTQAFSIGLLVFTCINKEKCAYLGVKQLLGHII